MIAHPMVPQGCVLLVTDRYHCYLDHVNKCHSNLVATTFANNEVEPVSFWEERLLSQRDCGPIIETKREMDPTEFEFSLALLIKDDDKDVVGAAVHEVYLTARCAFISYIVVAEWMRGKGAAGALLSTVFANGQSIIQQFFGPHEHLRAVFADVLQVRDDHSRGADADCGAQGNDRSKQFSTADRQLVYKRLGFKPLNLDFVHPGRFKGHRYNIAVASQLYDLNEKRFPASVVLQFIEGLVMGILADEGSTDDSEMHQWRSLLGDREYIEVGDEYWR